MPPEDGIGAYVVRARSATSFALDYLYIDPDYRQRGLGRWLMGHAIGLSESKGARELTVAASTDCDFLQRYGFALRKAPEGAAQWHFEFHPE